MEFLLPYMNLYKHGIPITDNVENNNETEENKNETMTLVEMKADSLHSCKIKMDIAEEQIDYSQDINQTETTIAQKFYEDNINEESISTDAMYHFFMSMYNISKEMPKKIQLQIRRKVFEIMSEAEEEYLMSSYNLQPLQTM